MSLAENSLSGTERRRLAAMCRWARGHDWEPYGLHRRGAGTWRNDPAGAHLDWTLRDDGTVRLAVHAGDRLLGDAVVHTTGQAADVLAAWRLLPAPFSDLYIAGAVAITEHLVEAASR